MNSFTGIFQQRFKAPPWSPHVLTQAPPIKFWRAPPPLMGGGHSPPPPPYSQHLWETLKYFQLKTMNYFYTRENLFEFISCFFEYGHFKLDIQYTLQCAWLRQKYFTIHTLYNRNNAQSYFCIDISNVHIILKQKEVPKQLNPMKNIKKIWISVSVCSVLVYSNYI